MPKWILAFDTGCTACRDIAGQVQKVAGDAITVAGLTDPRVQDYRQRALGPEAPWVPTLIAVQNIQDDTGMGQEIAVRAWTGRAMSARLTRLLGPRRSLQVARAIQRDISYNADRRRLLKVAPVVAAGAFLLSGGTAFADTIKQTSNGQGLTAAELMQRKFGITAKDLRITANSGTARQVLARSRANSRAQAVLTELRERGMTVAAPVAQKVEFPLNSEHPSSNPVLDLVRADLTVNGTTSGEYYHAIGPKGDAIFAIMPRSSGAEFVYDEKGQLASAVVDRGGKVLSSTLPIASVRFNVPDIQAVGCQGICGTLCAAGLGTQLASCVAGCLAGGPEDEPICAPLCGLLVSVGCLYGCNNVCCLCCNCS